VVAVLSLKWIGLVLALAAMVFLGPGARFAEAHQPRLIKSDDPVVISNPQVSQAFYAELHGRPALYRLALAQPTQIYMGLLVPDLPGQRIDFAVALAVDQDGGEQVILSLDGQVHEWTRFFEPFAGDSYLKGPEFERDLPAGTYLVRVHSPDNHGKYVLAVGREERFGLAGMIETLERLPGVKRFFGKSPLTAYFNVVGLFLLAAVVGVGLFGLLLLRWIVRLHRA
jgi:hypothetical protein